MNGADVYINTSYKLSLIKPNFESESILKADIESTVATIDVNSLNYWAVKILCTADPFEKVKMTEFVAEKWKNNELKITGKFEPPTQPYRKESLVVVDPGKIKRGKGGTLVSWIF